MRIPLYIFLLVVFKVEIIKLTRLQRYVKKEQVEQFDGQTCWAIVLSHVLIPINMTSNQ